MGKLCTGVQEAEGDEARLWGNENMIARIERIGHTKEKMKRMNTSPMKLTEEHMNRVGIDVECRYPVKANVRDNFRIAGLTKYRGKGTFALYTRKLNNPGFVMPMHIKFLSNVVHLGVPGTMCRDW